MLNLPAPVAAKIPPTVRARFDAAYLRQAARNTQALRQMVEIVTAFRAVRIPSLLLKGISLLRHLYSEPGYRALSDIDILVPAGTLDAAEHVLQQLGYTPMFHEGEGPAEARVSVEMQGHSAAFGRPGGLRLNSM